jgi:predicted Zn-dependent protease with MMP-like domain
MKRGFMMEHNAYLMGKHEPAPLSQYTEQASSWTDRILLNRKVLPNYCPTENLIKFV